MSGKATLALAAAVVLASEASAQTEMTPDAHATMDERMRGVTAGMRVQSPTGEMIGRVEDVAPDARTGRPDYVVIATTSGAKTAVPYSAIVPQVHDGHITLERSRLEGAPSVRDAELQGYSNTLWQEPADQYWISGDSTRHRPADANEGRPPKD
jgi:PRC-barrel domain